MRSQAGECTHIDEADVELLGGVSPLQVAPRVHVVVPDDPRDDVRGGDAFGSLRRYKHS